MRNKDRRSDREKAKGLIAESPIESGMAGSPGSPTASTPAPKKGTSRKCANCGQTGHIKTNKKCVNFHLHYSSYLVPLSSPEGSPAKRKYSEVEPSSPEVAPALASDASPSKKRKYIKSTPAELLAKKAKREAEKALREDESTFYHGFAG